MNLNQDERTVSTTQRWLGYGMVILSITLGIDLLVRILLLQQEPRDYIDISLIWIGTIWFVSIGMTANGIEPDETRWSGVWQTVLLLAITSTIVSAFIGNIHTLRDFISVMTSSATGIFVAIMIKRGIYSLWERRVLERESQ